MNIMSNGSFLDGMNASNKQEALVKSLTSAWEKKNSKVARAGGVSLMALSLAACGGSDDTPFSQADIDTALTDTSGTKHATVDAAITSNDATIAAGVDITTDNQAAIDDAVAAVDLTTDNAEAVTTALRDAAATLDVTGTSTMTNAELITAIKTANDAAISLGVDITTDNQAAIDDAVAAVDLTTDNAEAVTTALRDAAATLDVTGTSTMTNAELITAIKTANDAAIALGVDITTDNQAAIDEAVAAVDLTTDNAAAVTAGLKAAADDLGVTGTAGMTDAQLVEAIKTANDTDVANAVDKSVDDAAAINAAVAADTAFANLAELVAAYDALANPAAVDTTKTLTSATDNFTTTNGNDTFYALTDGDFATGDILNGGTGTDNLVAVFATAGASEAIRPVMTGIETVDIDVTDGHANATTTTLNLDQSTDVTSIRIGNNAFNTAADTVAVTNVGTAASLTVYDTAGHGSANANNYTMTYSGVSGTSDTATVNVEMSSADGALGTITIANVENVTANAIGGYDATYALTTADATTLTITAAADAATDATGGTVTATAVLAETLNVTSATDLTISDNTDKLIKVSDVNINSTVADEVVTITGLTTTATASTADAVTIDISGAGDAAVGVDTDFGTYNATTNADSVTVTGTGTGDVTVTMNTSAANIVTTGSGNDTLIIGSGQVLNDVDNINLGGGTGDTIAATAAYSVGHAAIDLFHDDDVTTTDPTISGVEIAQVTLRDEDTNDSTVSLSSSDFASQVTLIGAGAGGTIGDALSTVTVNAGQTVNLGDATSSFNDGTSGIAIALADVTGTSDSLTVTTNMVNSTKTGTLTKLTAAGFETLNLDLASTDANNTTVAGTVVATGTTALNLTGSKITEATVTAKDGATIDASAVTGVTQITVDDNAKDYTIKGSSTAANTFVMGTQLDDGDKIVAGSATTDTLSATVNGLDATTGALSISGVETIVLDTASAASTIDASSIVGATDIKVMGALDLTFTDVAAGVNFTLGTAASGAADDYSKQLSVALADATGSSDAITFNMIDTLLDNSIDATLVTSGIETVTLAVAADTVQTSSGTGDNDIQLDVSAVDATTLVITGGTAGEAVNLRLGESSTAALLNAATSTVDASAFDGTLVAAAATDTATTFTAKGAVGTLTGGAAGDVFTIGSTDNFLNASVGTVAGGAGSDTANVFAGGSSFDLDAVTAVETINITFDDVAGFDIGAGGGSDATITAATVTYAGGKAGEVYGSGSTGVLTDVAGRVIDASDLLGSIDITFGDDALVVANVSDAVTITGGQSALDVVNLVMTNSDTGEFTMSGVETIVASNITDTSTIDLTNVTGLTGITLHNATGDTTGKDFVLDKVAAGTAVTLGVGTTSVFKTQKVDINLADATGTSDTFTVNLVDTDSTTTVATVDADGIETLTLALANTAEGHNVALENNLTASTVVVTGTHVDADLVLSSIEAGITTVNASGLAGELTIADTARGSDAMTITGGTGADTIEMENAADVLEGGAGATTSDEVQVTFTGAGGAIVVDLSSTTDQVTLFNGLANSAAQTGFEDIDVSAYTQTGSNGADITGSTGANVVVGTDYADTISLGEGDDVYTVSTGNDVVDLGAGADTITFTGALLAGHSATSSTIEGGTGDDTVNTSTATLVDADFRGITNMEVLDFTTGDSTLTVGDAFAATGITKIDTSGTAAVAITQDTGDALGAIDSYLQISGYTVNDASMSFEFLGTSAVTDADLSASGFSISSGVYTDADGTAASFFTAAAAGFSAGDIGIYVTDGNTYAFAEGAATGATDDSYLEILGVELTSISATHGDLVFHADIA